MRRSGVAAALLLSVGAVGVGGAFAAQSRPTVRLCLRAWNSPLNAAARQRLAATGAWSASLRPGIAGTDTWRGTQPAGQTRSPACILFLTRQATERTITGPWAGDRVTSWRFGATIHLAGAGAPANVRIRRDGRISLL